MGWWWCRILFHSLFQLFVVIDSNVVEVVLSVSLVGSPTNFFFFTFSWEWRDDDEENSLLTQFFNFPLANFPFSFSSSATHKEENKLKNPRKVHFWVVGFHFWYNFPLLPTVKSWEKKLGKWNWKDFLLSRIFFDIKLFRVLFEWTQKTLLRREFSRENFHFTS